MAELYTDALPVVLVGNNTGVSSGNGTAAGLTIWSGTGVPAFAATVGDIYFRVDGTSGHYIYRCTVATGTWTVIL